MLLGGGLAALTRLAGPAVLPNACHVTGTNGPDVRLATDQAQIASVIGGVAVERGLPARAATIAVATAMQESKLRNLDYGDRDSLGVFQQRPSQGWGTPTQVRDPLYATRVFYGTLVEQDDYLSRPLTEVAQDVQRSGYPEAYAQHEDEAATIALAFTGENPHAVACRLDPASTSTPAGRIAADLDELFGTASDVDGGRIVTNTQSRRGAAAIAAWGVANAHEHGIDSVSHGGRTWTRSGDGDSLTWAEDPESGSGERSTVIRT